jgi:DNA-binding transcriptional MerR regulator
MPANEPQRVKMSVFAERAGVPIPTIKHYLREGLLPEPVRTSRNMAYYDATLIPKVRAIKRLQTEMYLPLRVIRQVLDRLEDEEIPPGVALEATVARVLAEQSAQDSLSRRQALDAGLSEEELDALGRMGVVQPEGERATYRDDDAALLRVLAQARRAGITEELMPTAALEPYLEALAGFVRDEVAFFRAGTEAHTGPALHKLAETATTLSERLMVLMRRKLLLSALRELDTPDV